MSGRCDSFRIPEAVQRASSVESPPAAPRSPLNPRLIPIHATQMMVDDDVHDDLPGPEKRTPIRHALPQMSLGETVPTIAGWPIRQTRTGGGLQDRELIGGLTREGLGPSDFSWEIHTVTTGFLW